MSVARVSPAYPATPLSTAVEAAALALAVLFVLLVFVGVPSLAPSGADPDARSAGNALNQLAQFALAGLALAIIAARRDVAWAIVTGRPLIWLALGLCLASAAWSDFPGITVRRAVAMLLFAVIALGAVAGPVDLRRLHAALLFALGLVVLFDLAALALAPAVAFDVDGARGLHSSKNVAGVAMAVVVACAAAWMATARRLAEAAFGGAVLLLGAAFLAITVSKTSIGLSVLIVGGGLVFLVLWRAGAALGVALGLGVVALGAVATLAAGVAHWSWPDALTVAFGDPTFTGRTPIWDFVLDEIARRPALGFGYGAFWDVGLENDPVLRAPLSNWLSQTEVGVINQAHNGYLDLAVQIGVPAAALALYVTLRALGAVTAMLATPLGDPGARGVAVFAFLLLALFALHNMMESSLLSRAIAVGNMVVFAVLATARLRLESAP